MEANNQEVFISNEFLRDASNAELMSVINETKQSLFTIRHQHAILRGKGMLVSKPHLIKGNKKLAARAMTILRQR